MFSVKISNKFYFIGKSDQLIELSGIKSEKIKCIQLFI